MTLRCWKRPLTNPLFSLASHLEDFCINFVHRLRDHQSSKAQHRRESNGLKTIVAVAGVAVLVHVQEYHIVFPNNAEIVLVKRKGKSKIIEACPLSVYYNQILPICTAEMKKHKLDSCTVQKVRASALARARARLHRQILPIIFLEATDVICKFHMPQLGHTPQMPPAFPQISLRKGNQIILFKKTKKCPIDLFLVMPDLTVGKWKKTLSKSLSFLRFPRTRCPMKTHSIFPTLNLEIRLMASRSFCSGSHRGKKPGGKVRTTGAEGMLP